MPLIPKLRSSSVTGPLIVFVKTISPLLVVVVVYVFVKAAVPSVFAVLLAGRSTVTLLPVGSTVTS